MPLRSGGNLNHAGSKLTTLDESVLVEHVSDVLSALVGDFDTDAVLVRSERR